MKKARSVFPEHGEAVEWGWGGGKGMCRSVLPRCPEAAGHQLWLTESFLGSPGQRTQPAAHWIICLSCGHFPCPCLATFLFCFINEYKVSFHRQPLKQNAWLLFQGKFLQKPHLTEPTHTHVLLYGFLSCSNVWEIANERWVIQRPEITAERLGLEFGQWS